MTTFAFMPDAILSNYYSVATEIRQKIMDYWWRGRISIAILLKYEGKTNLISNHREGNREPLSLLNIHDTS